MAAMYTRAVCWRARLCCGAWGGRAWEPCRAGGRDNADDHAYSTMLLNRVESCLADGHLGNKASC